MSGEDNFPKAGIKVKFLLGEFLEAAKTIGDIGDLTTGEVRVKFIMGLTEKTKSSYCQMLKDQAHWAYVDEPDAFISHAHGHKFKEFLSALEWKFHHDPEASIWLDLFSINQHEPMDWTFDWLSTTFRSNVADIGCTVMVMSPWNNPYPYTRTWCIFEAFSTIAEGGKFDIALSKTDEEAFLNEIRNEHAGHKMNVMVATIRAENSECSVENDRVSIYKIIRETIGFEKLDMMLFECYRKWVIDVAVHALQSSLYDGIQQRLGLFSSIFQLYQQQGNYERAELYARQGLVASKGVLGEDHAPTVNMMNNLAISLNGQGKYDEAVTLYQQCLEKNKAMVGDDDPGTLLAMNNLAVCLEKRGQYDEAVKLHQQCMERQKTVLGEDHFDTLVSMNNLALALNNLGQNNAAIELCQHCLEKRMVVLGEDHPRTLGTMSNLADALRVQGQYDKAIELYHRCLDRRKIVLSKDHPDTLRTMNNLAVALEDHGQYDEAIELYQSCLDSRKVILGGDHPETLDTEGNLADALRVQGQYNKAIDLYLHCLDRRKIVLGDDHPETLRTMDNLSVAQANQPYRSCLDRPEGFFA